MSVVTIWNFGVYHRLHAYHIHNKVKTKFSAIESFLPDFLNFIVNYEKILSIPSFGGEVKSSVPCRRFAACKRYLNLCGSRNSGKNYYRISFSPTVPPFAARISRVVADGGTWRLKWEGLKAGESIGNLPPRTCPGCSVPEPYRSHDWALVPAKPGLQG